MEKNKKKKTVKTVTPQLTLVEEAYKYAKELNPIASYRTDKNSYENLECYPKNEFAEKITVVRVHSEAQQNKNMEGIEKGEICNRNNCKGIIDESDKQGDGCSCHINPPCSYCCEQNQYCPECGWEAENA